MLRVATTGDLERQSAMEQSKHALRLEARRLVEEMRLPIKIIEAEPILGGERVTVFYASEERVDFRDLVRALGQQCRARVELRQVGARDEARLVADYERCGQYCCCKNFLKVLKPVSMRSAKVQKATLDPLKISGRCGRLMCCLRYEDQTYEDLRRRLPRKKTRVGTPEGDGVVIDGQILTQLVLVQLEAEDRQVAIPVENLTEPKGPPPAPGAPLPPGPPGPRDTRPAPRARPEPERRPPPPSAPREAIPELDELAGDELVEPGPPAAGQGASSRRRRRRRRRGRGPEGGPGAPPGAPPGQG